MRRSRGLILKRRDCIIIHTRGSDTLGHGHVVRAVALAEEARRRGLTVCFAPADESTAGILRAYGVNLSASSDSCSPSFVIRDLPGGSEPLDVRRDVRDDMVVMLLDDHGPAANEASIVVDAMMTHERAITIESSTTTRYLFGLQYAALRPEIICHAAKASPGENQLLRVVIALGGGFDERVPQRIAECLARRKFDGRCDVLLPKPVESIGDLRDVIASLNGEIHIQSPDVGAILSRADLVVTKIGISLLEALAVGVGCVSVEPTPAHVDVQRALASHYRAWPVIETGLYDSVSPDRAADAIVAVSHDPRRIKSMGLRARELIDGQGAARVLDTLLAAKP